LVKRVGKLGGKPKTGEGGEKVAYLGVLDEKSLSLEGMFVVVESLGQMKGREQAND